ncbi:MAG: 3-phosphoshikimate 1-carboxyvinyltransferase [Anaerolineae bacterium]|nr:3-phosphoshikimate 1-carboxyvinyltransferase [Gloeobacterales cyanobacterium ES-bin-313]
MSNTFASKTAQKLVGTIQVPGDKSISHRALMLGALAQGETLIEGLLPGEDPCSTAACLRQLGAEISPIDSTLVRVRGVGLGNFQESDDILNAGNSGTTMRLMLGLLSAQPGLFSCMTGDASLRSRPMDRVLKPLAAMGAEIWGREGGRRAPLAIRGKALRAFHYHSPIASAQVKSAILLAGLLIDGETSVTEPTRSRDHSERMLTAFGAKVIQDGYTATIQGPTQLLGQRVIVPGDISSAAFWLVAASIVPDSELYLRNVGLNPTRTGVLDVLLEMGANIAIENQRETCGEIVGDLRVRSAALKGCTIGGDLIPRLVDEIPILAVAACAAQGKTVIRDAAELRVKESDRLAVVARELGKLGAAIEEFPDGLRILGEQPLAGAEVQSYADHRIAMSLTIAGLIARGTTTIHEPACATVSYPNFFADLERIRTVNL